MIAQTPPMGWNTWNTFGENVSEQLLTETADRLVSDGYRDAGYEYLILDDCWALRERGEHGELVADPAKFPHGMRAVADYVHSKGLKFGMYSCAGILTCAGYPGSFDHEFQDAATFASWDVDYLKYDFCNFPKTADPKSRYQTMSLALKASGREILFAACNWGQEQSWNWMRSIGAHTYRSTGDIFDNYRSFTGIFKAQLENLHASAPFCFNDMDMLTVGMAGQGNVAIGRPCTPTEYRQQFAMWCLCGVPLIIGADIRRLDPEMRQLLLNPVLIAIDQDADCRPPFLISKRSVFVPVEDPENAVDPLRVVPDQLYTLIRHLSGNRFVIACLNFHETEQTMNVIFSDFGLPLSSGYGLTLTDAFTGESAGFVKDYLRVSVPGHDVRLYVGTLESAQEQKG